MMEDLCNVSFHDEPPPERPAPGRRWRLVLWGAVALVVVGGAVTGGYLLWRDEPVFTLEAVELRGATLLSADEALGLAGLHKGMSLLSIDEARATAALKALPFLRSASLERALPRTLRMTLVDRLPAIRVALGPEYVADEEGVVYRRVRPGEKLDLPLLRGLGRDDVGKRPSFVAERVREALLLARAAGDAGRLCLDHIGYHEVRGFNLKLCGGPEVQLGAPPFAHKLLLLPRALRVHPRARVIYLDDDRRPERVVVRTARAGG
jgi:cell division protein FtsQ